MDEVAIDVVRVGETPHRMMCRFDGRLKARSGLGLGLGSRLGSGLVDVQIRCASPQSQNLLDRPWW